MQIIGLGAAQPVANALIPPEGPAAIPLSFDFTADGEPAYSVNVLDLMQKGPGFAGLSILQCLYADLANASQPLVVQLTATGQRLVIPPKTQGYYPIIAPSRGYLNVQCADTDAIISVFLLNVPVPPNQWPTTEITAGIADAPSDGQDYVRSNGEWVVLPAGGGDGGIGDAPEDGKTYGRQSGNWAPVAIQADAPADGTQYARENGQWAASTGGGGGGGGGDDGGGTNPPPSGHKYWRIASTAPNSGNGVYSVAELSMAGVAGGANLCVGGTPLASSSYNGTYAPSNAFDGNIHDQWSSATANVGEYIGYEFTQAQSIAEVKITTTDDAPYNDQQAFTAFNLDYSDDGVNWTTAKAFNATTPWGVSQVQTFDV